MDPDKTLSDLLAWAQSTVEEAALTDDTDLQEAASFSQQLLDLDSWISKGGFLPRRWAGY